MTETDAESGHEAVESTDEPHTIALTDPCIECGDELFGEQDDPLHDPIEGWSPTNVVEGRCLVGRDGDDLRFTFRFRCRNCDHLYHLPITKPDHIFAN